MAALVAALRPTYRQGLFHFSSDPITSAMTHLTCSGAAQVVEVKIAVLHAGMDLRPVEGAAKVSVDGRHLLLFRTASGCRPGRAKGIVKRDSHLTAVPALAGRQGVGIGAKPYFTRLQIKLLILSDTTHLCSHNISLNFILDVDVGSGFSPNQRDKSTLKHQRPIL